MAQEDDFSEYICAPVHQSLTRPHLMNGCDRELFLLTSLISALVIGPVGFLAGRILVGVAGIVLFVGGRVLLGYMAKLDPKARVVYQKAMTYRDFYPSVSYIRE